MNLSNRTLTEEEEEVLKEGMKFTPSPSRIPKEDKVAKEKGTLFGCPNQKRAEARARIACLIKTAKVPKRNTSKKEWKAKSNLQKDKNVVILEVDKGNVTVEMESIDYDKKAMELIGHG